MVDVREAEAMVANLSLDDLCSNKNNVEILRAAFEALIEERNDVERLLKEPDAVYHNILRGSIVLPSTETALLKAKAAEEKAARAVGAAKEILRGAAILREGMEYVSPGEVTENQKAKIRADPLYRKGDCILVWVNEGAMFNSMIAKSIIDRAAEQYGDIL